MLELGLSREAMFRVRGRARVIEIMAAVVMGFETLMRFAKGSYSDPYTVRVRPKAHDHNRDGVEAYKIRGN